MEAKDEPIEYHEYIVIGAGISGIHAGLILAEQNKDFIILEASDTIGGRIRTETLSDVIKNEKIDNKNWVTQEMKNTQVEVGATWISKEHSYILKMIQEYELTLFPQYSDGLAVYGVSEQKYQKVETLAQFYKKYQKQLLRLMNKIQNLQLNVYQYSSSTTLSPAQSNLFEQYIKLYDNMTVSKFIKSQIQDQQLADMIMNQMQTLECISCDNFSVLQLIDDDGCMELLKLYCEKIDDTIDGLKVKEGMMELVRRMARHITEVMEENQSEYLGQQIVRINSPVVKIDNPMGEDVTITLKNGKKYSCIKALFTVPIAVASQIQITNISPSKKLIFQNQQYGSVTRFYFVFKQAFWRGRYNGYCSFSRNFPFNQLTELSPSSLSCGILAFVFVHNKFQMWQEQLKNERPSQQNIEKIQVQYMLQIISNMFLGGGIDRPQLQNYFTYKRSFKNLQYIRAAYQTTTKPQVWKKIKDSGDDYGDSYSRDEYNIIYLGSELAEGEEYASYMEGAVRITREKVYAQLGKKDPWLYMKDKVIEW